MNNKNIQIGKTYIIDKGFHNSGKVELVHIYGKLFCRVKDPETGGEWDTMIYRLSEYIAETTDNKS